MRHIPAIAIALFATGTFTGCADAPALEDPSSAGATSADAAYSAEDLATDIDTIEDDQWDPPYAGMDFQVRIELGLATPTDTVAGVEVDRLMTNIDGTWQGQQVPDGYVELDFNTEARWTAIYEGDIAYGEMYDLDVMLGEYMYFASSNETWDEPIVSEDRDFTLHPSVHTDTDRPLVITALLEFYEDENGVQVELADTLVRWVDEDGYAWSI